MKKLTLLISTLLLTQAIEANAQSVNEGLSTALKDGKAGLQLRYRYEFVDQDGIAKQADASTLKTRFTWNSGTVANFKGLLEVDNVSVIGGEQYNSTTNGLSQYPVVADPEATVVNQAALAYGVDQWGATLGRQRIQHGNERFLGSVAWRQLEQTFDALRLTAAPTSALKLDYSYMWRVNTVFGPDSANGRLDGQLHALRADYQLAADQSLSGFGYYLDYNDPIALSSATYGLEYAGSLASYLKARAALATQSDAADAPVDYSALYYLAELTADLSAVNLTLGYEVLGSDDGKKGFATPLATGHKFQGFADKFLTTPNNGVRDLYAGVAGKLEKLGYGVTWHQFEADHGGQDYGQEWDLQASYPLTPYLSGLVKYAHYDSDGFATDTDKAWLMLTASF